MSLVLDVTMDEVLEWALCKDEMSTHPDQCETVDYIVRHEAVQKMRVGPSESACRS